MERTSMGHILKEYTERGTRVKESDSRVTERQRSTETTVKAAEYRDNSKGSGVQRHQSKGERSTETTVKAAEYRDNSKGSGVQRQQ
jgi:hypothetical protein